jgi:hypothetical protein
MLTDATVHAMLDAEFPTGTGTDRAYLSAHSAYSATGASLLGSKVAGAWAAAASRAKAITAAIDIPVAAGETVKWIGYWGGTAGDTFLGMSPNGGSDKSFQVDVTNNRIYCEAHGLIDDNKIVFHGAAAPAGLTAGTTYFVVGTTAGDPDYIEVAATLAGAAIDITGQAAAGCVLSKIVEETYAGDGTHRVSTLTITL